MNHFIDNLKYFINWKAFNVAQKRAEKYADSDKLHQFIGFLACNHNKIMDRFIEAGLKDGTVAFVSYSGRYTQEYSGKDVYKPYRSYDAKARKSNNYFERYTIYTIQNARQSRFPGGQFLKWLPKYDSDSVYASIIVKDKDGNYSAPVSLIQFPSRDECAKNMLFKAAFLLETDFKTLSLVVDSAFLIKQAAAKVRA